MHDRRLAEVHARAFNGHDVDLLVHQSLPGARILRDGELLGEGPEALRDGIEAEYRTEMTHARALELDGEPVLAEFTGDEGNEVVRGIIRFKSLGGRLEEVRIDHDEDACGRLDASLGRRRLSATEA